MGAIKGIDKLAEKVDVVWKSKEHKRLLYFPMLMDKELQDTVLSTMMNMIWIVGVNQTEPHFIQAIQLQYEKVMKESVGL